MERDIFQGALCQGRTDWYFRKVVEKADKSFAEVMVRTTFVRKIRSDVNVTLLFPTDRLVQLPPCAREGPCRGGQAPQGQTAATVPSRKGGGPKVSTMYSPLLSEINLIAWLFRRHVLALERIVRDAVDHHVGALASAWREGLSAYGEEQGRRMEEAEEAMEDARVAARETVEGMVREVEEERRRMGV